MGLSLRKAEINDAETLLKWRNDPSSRAMFFDNREVSWDEHIEWFRKALLKPNCHIYIALNEENKVVGSIRSELNEGQNILSWVIDANERGKGYGKDMLRQMCKKINGPVIAKILNINEPSKKMVMNCGFVLVNQKDAYTIWKLIK